MAAETKTRSLGRADIQEFHPAVPRRMLRCLCAAAAAGGGRRGGGGAGGEGAARIFKNDGPTRSTSPK